MLNTALIKDLTIAQNRRYQTLVAEAKRALKPESEKIKRLFIDSEVQKAPEAEKKLVRKKLEAITSETGVLYGGQVLMRPNPDGTNENFTVEDIYANRSKFDKLRICDPEEPDYDNGRPVAIINAMGPRPSIRSFAHGGKKYDLVRKKLAHADKITARDIYNPNKSTDMGNAERFNRLAGDKIIFVQNIGWHLWDGCRYVSNEEGVKELYKALVIKELYNEVSQKAQEHDTQSVKDMANWAKRSESDKNIISALASAASMEGIFVKPEDLDSDPMLLNVINGTLNLQTGALKNHDPDDLITKLAPVEFDPEATAPIWDRTLNRIFAGNQALINFFKRAIGYSITGKISEQCWFIMHGVGANGKSLTSNSLKDMLGDYAGPGAPNLLMMARGGSDRHPTELADLMGKRMVVCQETEEGRRLSEVLVKQMTGGDAIKARYMRQDFFEFDPTHKLWVATNHKPVIKDTTESTWRRIRLIPFEVVIPAAERDQELPKKLKKEWSGILNWALEGCLEWQRDGMNPPEEVMAATSEYRNDQDIISKFIAEECFESPELRTQLNDLFEGYKSWCERNCEIVRTKNAFSRGLTEREYVKEVSGVTFYRGLGLKIDKSRARTSEYEQFLVREMLKKEAIEMASTKESESNLDKPDKATEELEDLEQF